MGKQGALQDAKLTADSGFHSKDNLRFLHDKRIDSCIADTGFRSRNPLFQHSKTYQKHQQTRRKQRNLTKDKLFTPKDFHFDRDAMTCSCPAGKPMWLSSKKPHLSEGHYY
ncbi:hypothetical protein PN836_001785 [Ningiella sp. W23]|uniref:hypothetical protein n=1 Tax=Ningiella sp. W23 TaxID=3023715 RepID=UPI0037566015